MKKNCPKTDFFCSYTHIKKAGTKLKIRIEVFDYQETRLVSKAHAKQRERLYFIPCFFFSFECVEDSIQECKLNAFFKKCAYYYAILFIGGWF